MKMDNKIINARSDESPGYRQLNMNSVTDELRIRYFRGVHQTTRLVLETVVSIVYLTCYARGFTSTLSNVEKEVGWRQSFIKRFFTAAERKRLDDDPTQKPYEIKLNIKLLTRAWTWLGETVVAKVQHLQGLLESSIYDPPNIWSLDHLSHRLSEIFTLQTQLTDIVRKLCHEKLIEALKMHVKEKNILKSRLIALTKIMFTANIELHFLPLKRALTRIELFHHIFCVDESQLPKERESSMHDYRTSFSQVWRNIEELERKLGVYLKASKEQKSRIDMIIFCIYEIIKISGLPDVVKQIYEVEVTDISKDLLLSWHQELMIFQEDKKAQLKALGKSEMSSYILSMNALLDINKWLMTKTHTYLHVTKIFSTIKNLGTNVTTNLESFLDDPLPQVIIIYGPIGSGKSCLCQYIFDEWRENSSCISWLKKFQLLVVLKPENVFLNSFTRHLKNNIFKRSLEGVKQTDVLNVICHLKVLIIVDASSVAAPSFIAALKEILTSLGKSSFIITAQLGISENIRHVLRDMKMDFLEGNLQPLSDTQLDEMCTYYMKSQNPSKPFSTVNMQHSEAHIGQSCFFQPLSDLGVTVRNFIKDLLSKMRDKGIFYPLPLAYMLMLWLKKREEELNKIMTVSQLFERVILFCQPKNEMKVKGMSSFSRCTSSTTKDNMETVYNMASRAFTNIGGRLSDGENHLHGVNISNVSSDSLYPLFTFCGNNRDEHNQHHKFLHPCIIDILYARATVSKVSNGNWTRFHLFGRDVARYLPLTRIRESGWKYRNVIGYVCGFLTSKQRTTNALYLIEMYKCAGVSNTDYPAWASLLSEGSWCPEMVKAVARVLDVHNEWIVPIRSYQECQAVSQLINHGAYHPHEILVKAHPCDEVLKMLASRPLTNVRILPAGGFHGVSECSMMDNLLCEIHKSGNVTEFWGKLDQEGTVALASMSRLHTIYVHLASVAALHAFCKSIQLCPLLRYLHLHLDLPVSTPTSKVPTLRCPPHTTVCLVLSGIKDDSWVWAADVSKLLGCRYKEVNLIHSQLSSDRLQQLKQKLHPTPVHTT